jgi:hypothetical protein
MTPRPSLYTRGHLRCIDKHTHTHMYHYFSYPDSPGNSYTHTCSKSSDSYQYISLLFLEYNSDTMLPGLWLNNAMCLIEVPTWTRWRSRFHERECACVHVCVCLVNGELSLWMYDVVD